MSISHETYYKTGMQGTYYTWINIPNKCPRCNTILEPKKLNSEYVEDTNSFYVTYFCNSCKKPFLAEYYETRDEKFNPVDYFLSPTTYIPKKFEDRIEERFSNFCTIYNQALQAETEELSEIAGIGYRKSLEFLIKDYCIYHNAKETEKIKNMSLSQVIDNYIEAPKIKSNAKAATWLGNDETHYVRKYEDKDIKDLKNFINATVSYINYDLISDEAEEIVTSK